MLFKYWDDQCVLYDTSSANTHLLHSPAAKFLELMISHSEIEALIAAIRQEQTLQLYHDMTNSELIEVIGVQSAQFKSLQLIN